MYHPKWLYYLSFIEESTVSITGFVVSKDGPPDASDASGGPLCSGQRKLTTELEIVQHRFSVYLAVR